MHIPSNRCPSSRLLLVCTSITYAEGLAQLRRIPRQSLAKVLADVKAELEAVSLELQRRALT